MYAVNSDFFWMPFNKTNKTYPYNALKQKHLWTLKSDGRGVGCLARKDTRLQ